MSEVRLECSINHAELSVVFATANHIPFLLKLAPRVPVMKVIVSMDPLSEETKRVLASWAEERNVKVMDLPERTRAHDPICRLSLTWNLYSGRARCRQCD